jgi:uncharacterized protein involved in exopolysaccharide biosynthesis
MAEKVTNNFNNEIDFLKLYQIIWNSKIFIITCTSIFSILSVIYALSLPNIYTSKTLLMPTSSEDSLSSRLGSFSSLAQLSGVNLATENVTKSQEAIERIKSLIFFKEYFLPNIKLENIVAQKDWDPLSNSIIYNDKIYDSKNKKWTRKSNDQNNYIPTDQDAYKNYLEILDISENNKNSFISISVKHVSPHIAKEWLDIIIFNINESMREEDKNNAKNAINFLIDESNSTNIKSILDQNSQLLEAQMQTLMLASSNDAYIFKVLDPPYVPEKKSWPTRSMISITGFFMGLFFSLLLIFYQFFRKSLLNDD